MGVEKADIHDVSSINAETVGKYEVLILGTSTWGDGELQDDWYDGVEVLKGTDLTGKKSHCSAVGIRNHIPTLSATAWD